MSDVRWTYKKITERSEERIDAFLGLARTAADEEDKRDVAYVFLHMAEGVFEAWCGIVGGERTDADTERFRKQLDAVKAYIK